LSASTPRQNPFPLRQLPRRCLRLLEGKNKTAADEKDISRIIVDRLRAVARAQDFLSITSNEGADLRELTEAIIGPLCPNPVRIELAGPSIKLRPESTTSFAMVLHELATNAIKHGAWKSNCEGKVAVLWRLAGAQLWFHWLECGAVLVSPAKLGFGSKLIQQSLRDAKVVYVLHPDGAQCTISLNL
jgi:two-component sensor histidine kinase